MAAKIQDTGNSLGFHLLSHLEGENPDSDQKVKGLWARTPVRQGHEVQEVAASLFMIPVASENILYHLCCWLSTNSKVILYYHLESHFQMRWINKLIVKHL